VTGMATHDTECVECGQPADPYSPADDDNGIDAGRRCWRHWLTDPADIRPSPFYVKHDWLPT
jgi:hypothetical protein